MDTIMDHKFDPNFHQHEWTTSDLKPFNEIFAICKCKSICYGGIVFTNVVPEELVPIDLLKWGPAIYARRREALQ